MKIKEAFKPLIVIILVLGLLFIMIGSCSSKENYSSTDKNLCGCGSQFGQYLSQCAKPSDYMLTSSRDACADFAAPYSDMGDIRAVPSKYDKNWYNPYQRFGHSEQDRYVRAPNLAVYATSPNPYGVTPCQRYCKQFYQSCMRDVNDPERCTSETKDTCLDNCNSAMTSTPMEALEEGNQLDNHPTTFCSQSAILGCPSGGQDCIENLQSSCEEIFDV